MIFDNYDSIIFDCDGVILNSNRIKSNAFFETVKPFGEKYALQLVNYNMMNGGISRYEKFNYFITEILPQNSLFIDINELLIRFSSIVKTDLIKCDVTFGLDMLRESCKSINWSIVSGGDEEELNYIFRVRNIYHYFNSGIFGSPANKFQIVTKGINSNIYNGKVLFLGDSKFDYEVARHFGFDFIFVYQWTEFKDWQKFCRNNNIIAIKEIVDLLSLNLIKF
jgi:phosphoglycolate phosphatase-like HAD superfamily hydrolase